jgi:hypothetical protein
MNKQQQGRQGAWRWLSKVWLVMWLLGCCVPHIAQAHGGAHEESATPLANQPVGPYWLTVTTAPARLQIGAVHFAVLVQHGRSQHPLITAQVEIEATPLDASGPALSGRAAWSAVRLMYDADLTFAHSGRYQIAVYVRQAHGMTHRTTFVATVYPGTFFKWLTIMLLGQATTTAIWLLREAMMVWQL